MAARAVGFQRFEVAVVVVVKPSNALIDLLQLPLGLLENTAVDKNHDDQRDVEGDDGGGDGIGHVGVELAAAAVLDAFLGFLIIRYPPLHVDGQERYQRSDHPHQHHHDASSALGQHGLVAERRSDGQVTVYGDHAQRLDACGHTQHISRSPELTPETTKVPSLKYDVTGAEGYHNEAHDQVGTSQGRNETVGDVLETLKAGDRRDDEDVAKDDAQNQEGHDHAQQDHCYLAVTLLLFGWVRCWDLLHTCIEVPREGCTPHLKTPTVRTHATNR